MLYYWIDLIWVPVLFFGVHKRHRWYASGFAVVSIILVHTLSEIMTSIGYEYGIMGFMESKVHTRLLIVSSVFYTVLLGIAHYSPRTEGVIFMAESLSLFFIIFVVGSIVMVL